MKNLKKGLHVLALLCIYLSSSAQKPVLPREPDHNKPRLFQQVPNRVSLANSTLLSLLELKNGETASIPLASQAIFAGTVISSTSKYNNSIKTLVIKSTNMPGAHLTISRVTHPDGRITYSGRIVSFQHGDCFELKTENGQFILIKKNFEDLVND